MILQRLLQKSFYSCFYNLTMLTNDSPDSNLLLLLSLSYPLFIIFPVFGLSLTSIMFKRRAQLPDLYWSPSNFEVDSSSSSSIIIKSIDTICTRWS